MDRYTQGCDNLQTILHTSSPTGVRFLVYARDPATSHFIPAMRSTFVNRVVCGYLLYLLPGHQTNTVLVFEESHLKYLVVGSRVVANASSEAANAGDHMTFTIQRVRSHPDGLLMKTHWTSYSESPDGYYTRDEDPCNIIVDTGILASNLALFKDTLCEVRPRPGVRPSGKTMENVYDTQMLCMNFQLCRAVFGSIPSGGRRKRRMKGGSAPKEYKGIGAFDAQFEAFVVSTILERVATLRDDLVRATIIYDSDNALARGANAYFLIVYDFDGVGMGMDENVTRNIFHVDTRDTLVACYVHDALRTGKPVTDAERRTYDKYLGSSVGAMG
jgi:hypothetical protein